MPKRIANISTHHSERLQTATGILGALLLTLPTAGHSGGIDAVCQLGSLNIQQRTTVERYTAIQNRLSALLDRQGYSGEETQSQQRLSQWANWSDWRNY